MSALGATQPQALRDDRDLVAAVRCGDDHAFGELYARYGRRIVSYVLGMVGDHGRAEDITQEVFMSALTRMRATDRPIAFKPWVYEIAKNACIDEFRRTRRVREVPLEPDDSPGDGEHKLVSLGQSPHTAAERRQQLNDLRSAFRGLSDNHHKILVLRELEGLSYAEIGHRLGMTRPVVESTLFRARRRLGQEYEEIASGRRCEQVRGVIDAGGTKAVLALGVRERRRLARHVSHCQPCRKYAWLAGVEQSAMAPPTAAERLAALLPIPAFLRWRRGGGENGRATRSGWHSFTPLRSVQALAQVADPTAPALSTIGDRAAAAVAAVVIAGGAVAGGVAVHNVIQPSHAPARSAAVSSRGTTLHRTTFVTHRSAGTHVGANETTRAVATSEAVAAARSLSAGHTPSGGSAPTSGAASQATVQATGRTTPSGSHPPGSPALTVGNSANSAAASTSALPRTPSLPLPTIPQVQLPQIQLSQLPNALPGIALPGVQSVVNTLQAPVNAVEGALGLVSHVVGGR